MMCKYIDCVSKGAIGFKRSGHHYSRPSSGQRPHRCRSRAVLRPYCRGRWCVEGSRASAFVWGSPRCHGGQSNHRCHRTAVGEASFSWVPCHGCREKASSSMCNWMSCTVLPHSWCYCRESLLRKGLTHHNYPAHLDYFHWEKQLPFSPICPWVPHSSSGGQWWLNSGTQSAMVIHVSIYPSRLLSIKRFSYVISIFLNLYKVSLWSLFIVCIQFCLAISPK